MATVDETPLVLVTGASGYLGSHVVQLLVSEGHRVRAALRNVDDAKFLQAFPGKHQVEVVEADLLNEESWNKALEGCTYVVHVAGPTPHSALSNDPVKLAVDGTKAVLKAAAQSGTVKRVVLTSSISAICDQSQSSLSEREGKPFTEEDWSNPDSAALDAYGKAKTLQEKAAWDLVKELPEESKFELAVINPGLCIGPLLRKTTHGVPTSVLLIKRFMDRPLPLVPPASLSVVDVRDVAQAHVKALFSPDAANHRHIVTNQSISVKDMATALAKEFKPHGYSICTAGAPYFLMWLNSLVDKKSKLLLSNTNTASAYDTSRMKDVLSLEPRDVQQSIVDTAYSMIQLGVVKKSKKMKKQEMSTESETHPEGEVNGVEKEAPAPVEEEAQVNGVKTETATENEERHDEDVDQETSNEATKEPEEQPSQPQVEVAAT
ncbi:uncharacterized protein LOC135367346 [Ornithodoros turicata]|uniref:uncharacterized protein LOC135367346 n=1 Tax=Ornithodoros turicata TaxID=34597 RepID=UPI003138DE30